jgi:hypothetical protein
MPDIRLPDGSIATFPDEMGEAEIAAALDQCLPHKDAEIRHLPQVDLYMVCRTGRALGFRATRAEAISLADSLPPLRTPRTSPSRKQQIWHGDLLSPHDAVVRAESRQRSAEIREGREQMAKNRRLGRR